MIRRLCRRIAFFFAVVWRPVTGPSGGETPMSDFQVWWHYGIPVRTAWSMSEIRHGKGEHSIWKGV